MLIFFISFLACSTETKPKPQKPTAEASNSEKDAQKVSFFQEKNPSSACCPIELYYALSSEEALSGEIVFWHVYEETEGFDGVGMEVLSIRGRQEGQQLVLQHQESQWGADLEAPPGWAEEEIWIRKDNQLQHRSTTLVETALSESQRDKFRQHRSK